MRMLLYLLLVSSEIVSTPIAPRNNLLLLGAPAIAMARDSEGVVIAWAERNDRGLNRINVARLNESAYQVGSIHVLPAGEGADASFPSIASLPSGSGFTIAWMELESSSVRTMVSRLDAALTPSTPVLLTASSVQSTRSPAVVRSGSSTWITSASLLWRVRSDGSFDPPIDSGVPASDMIANGALPRLVGAMKPFAIDTCLDRAGCQVWGGPFKGYCYPECVVHTQQGYGLRLMAPYTTLSGPSFHYESDAQPAISGHDTEVLIAWYSGPESSGGAVVVNKLTDQSLADFGQLALQPRGLGDFPQEWGAIRPDIATDGERYVVVWQTKRGITHDIEGAAIDRDGTVTPFTVANSADDERDPSVISTRPGAFLVAYEKISPAGRRLAGRQITFDGRVRVVR